MRCVRLVFFVLVLCVAVYMYHMSAFVTSATRSQATAISPEPTSQQRREQQQRQQQQQHRFGFFYQCYKQPKATLEVVRSVKEPGQGNMREAPIYLISSSGYNYQPLADRYSNVKFVYSTLNVSPKQQSGAIWTYFDRMRDAALWCNCSYLVILEDDTYLQRPLGEAPHDAGGVQSALWNGNWDPKLVSQYARPGHWSYLSHGLCGGSYVRTTAFLDAYRRVDLVRIAHMSTLVSPIIGIKSVPSNFIGMKNDVTLAVMMMDANYTLLPWDELAEAGKPNQNPNPSIVHSDKNYYGMKLTREDGHVTLPGDRPRTVQGSLKNRHRTISAG